MADSKNKIEEKPLLNTSTLIITKIEDESVIVLVDGWRMRIYFEKEVDKSDYYVGKEITVSHYGNIQNPHEVKFQKIK